MLTFPRSQNGARNKIQIFGAVPMGEGGNERKKAGLGN